MQTVPRYSIKKNETGIPTAFIKSSIDAAGIARALYEEDEIPVYESFYLVMLNNALQVAGYAKIGQGGITATTVDIRLIAKFAIESLATHVILVHNHPSGNLRPSADDLNLTKRIASALEIFAIKVADHIILTEFDYYSMTDHSDI